MRLSTLIRNYGDVFRGLRSSGVCKPLLVELGQKMGQVVTGEGPLERFGDLLVVVLEVKQAFLKFSQRAEVVRCKDLALNNGEVDFDLVQPAGMNRCVDQDCRGPLRAKAVRSFLAAMSRAVIHNPEDTGCGSVRLLAHHFADQPVNRKNAGLGFAVPKQFGSVDIPGREISPRTCAEVFMFDAGWTPRPGGERSEFAPSSLDTGLLIRGDDEFGWCQPHALPDTLVEVENAASFSSELRIAGKDPTPVPPGTEGIGTQPAPKRGAADFCHHPLRHHVALDLRD